MGNSQQTNVTIIGATAPAPGHIGLVFNVGTNVYMVTGRPSAIEAVTDKLMLFATMLAKRPMPKDDNILGKSTVNVGKDDDQKFITGPYNAIAAIRDICL